MSELKARDGCRIAYEDSGIGPVLLFIHGWGMSSRIWRYQREEFSATNRVILLNLRGHGGSEIPPHGPCMADFAADITMVITHLDLREVTIIAWSMGVTAAAVAFPSIRHRLAAMVLVGGTPRFTAGDGFLHGLPTEEIRGMILRLRRNYGRTMEEFFRGMFAQGELDTGEYDRIVRDIVKGGVLPEQRIVLCSLESLAATDLRPLLTGLDRPIILVHGTQDSICMPEASRFMAERIPGAQLLLLQGIGHAPFLSRPDQFNNTLREHLATTNDLHLAPPRSPAKELQSPFTIHHSPSLNIDRLRVQSSFHEHANDYECHARVQRRVVNRLLGFLEQINHSPQSVLDIGCGTGMLLKSVGGLYNRARLSGIDLAEGMVTATRSALAGRNGVVIRQGDAERVPFPDGEFDLVISTSTFQWLEQLSTAFDEAYRVLAPGGTFLFALFGARTLFELKESYSAAVALHGDKKSDRTHRFLPPSAVMEQLMGADFAHPEVWFEDETEYHPDVPALLRSLKKIGAGNASPERARGLAERRVMLTMMKIYEERYGEKGGIPATYEVIYGKGSK